MSRKKIQCDHAPSELALLPAAAPRKIAALVSALLEWFAHEARSLPWRDTRDPYAIWVSEIMLQQTQVKTVIPYWERWMKALPTIRDLAEAETEAIHKLWEGLGYYTRVRNMQQAAREIMAQHGGKFPTGHEAILALPGIGPYTAGAISSIAFNEPRPILDGNVIRVLTRLFAIAENPREKSANKKLWQLAAQLVTAAAATHHAPRTTSCSHLNQSLMELGALICTPRQPRCPQCPVRARCTARRGGRVQDFPNLGPRTAATERRFVAVVMQHRERFLVRQRAAGQVNAHLWEFPNFEITGRADGTEKFLRDELGLAAARFSRLRTIKHTITRYRITLEVFLARVKGVRSPRSGRKNSIEQEIAENAETQNRNLPDGAAIAEKSRFSVCGGASRWLELAELNALAFSSAHRKILREIAASNLP